MTDAAMSDNWPYVLGVVLEQGYRTLDADPNILFEHDGGPEGAQGDYINARLIGYEDEVVTDMPIRSVTHEIRMPLRRRLTLASFDEPPTPSIRVATYVLQSGWAMTGIAAEYAPPKMPYDLTTFSVRVLMLRYRRRS